MTGVGSDVTSNPALQPLRQGAYLEKRIRERARKEKQQEKEQRRQERKRQSENKPAKDSDLEGMRPGPQPGQILNIE